MSDKKMTKKSSKAKEKKIERKLMELKMNAGYVVFNVFYSYY